MSAIAGILHPDGKPVDRASLERMQSLLTPYGRDAQNHWQAGSVALMRALLRITPEDSLDHQPMLASGLVVVFDGRLDNREELAGKLGIEAAELRLLADSELALRACSRWDEAAPEHLLGDYALACWHTGERRLWLARDPLGHRPLFWHQRPGLFAFASMPKALFAIPGVPRALCEERLADYLALLPMVGPQSFFKDIYRVEPGHLLTLEGERVTTRRHHRFDAVRELRLGSDGEYLEAFSEHLERAIACRLRSTGPIASHLSSGFDSSTITAIAAKQLAARGQHLFAYTAVPREGFAGRVQRGRHGDEGPGARALAARFANIDHILLPPGGATPLDHLQANVEAMDRAPLNPCNGVWGHAIEADAARRGAKVMLTGQMGNMSISYTGEQYLPALLGQGKFNTWWREASAFKRTHPDRRWLGMLAQSVGPYVPAALWVLIERYKGRGRKLTDYTAIHPDFMARMNSKSRAAAAGWDLSYRPWSNGRKMRIAVINRLDNGDHFAAANARSGLEVRDPTSDLRLLEFCLAVPDSQYLRDGQERWLLRRLMGEVLPPEILETRSKGLQAADWYEGVEEALPRIREELARMVEHGGVGEYLDLETLKKDLEAWPQSGWEDQQTVQTYRLKLLRGLSVGTFIRYVEENNR